MAEVRHNPDERRYEILVDGTRAGFAEYVQKGGRLLFVHTEIDPAYSGQGLGTQLVRGALDDVRAQGVPIVPLCPFVAAYIERHPEDADLVDHELLRAIETRR